MTQWDHFSHRLTRATSLATGAVGSFPAIFAAILLIVVWGLSGPLFHFSGTWQLVINTSTTIVTFIMVFIIQNTQNREGRAVQTKLDAILQKLGIEDDDLLGIEDVPEKQIKSKQEEVRGE